MHLARLCFLLIVCALIVACTDDYVADRGVYAQQSASAKAIVPLFSLASAAPNTAAPVYGCSGIFGRLADGQIVYLTAAHCTGYVEMHSSDPAIVARLDSILVFDSVQRDVKMDWFSALRSKAIIDWGVPLEAPAFVASHNDILAVPITEVEKRARIRDEQILDVSAEKLEIGAVVQVYGYPSARPIPNAQGFETCTYQGAGLSTLTEFKTELRIDHRLECDSAVGQTGISGGVVVYHGKTVGVISTQVNFASISLSSSSKHVTFHAFSPEFAAGKISDLRATPQGKKSFLALSDDGNKTPYVIEASYAQGYLDGVTKYVRPNAYGNLDKTIAWFAITQGFLDTEAPVAANVLSCSGVPVRVFFHDPNAFQSGDPEAHDWFMRTQFLNTTIVRLITLGQVLQITSKDVHCPGIEPPK